METESSVLLQKRTEHYNAFCSLVDKIEQRLANESDDSEGELIVNLADSAYSEDNDVENNPPITKKQKKKVPKDISTCRCHKTGKIVKKIEGELQSNLGKILRNRQKNTDNGVENYNKLAMQEFDRLAIHMPIIQIQHYIVYLANKAKRVSR